MNELGISHKNNLEQLALELSNRVGFPHLIQSLIKDLQVDFVVLKDKKHFLLWNVKQVQRQSIQIYFIFRKK